MHVSSQIHPSTGQGQAKKDVVLQVNQCRLSHLNLVISQHDNDGGPTLSIESNLYLIFYVWKDETCGTTATVYEN